MESLILKNLIENEAYAKRIIPFVNTNYFNNFNDKKIINLILKFYKQYNKIPSFDEVVFDIKNDIREDLQKEVEIRLNEISSINENLSLQKLVDETEKFFKSIALTNAIIECAQIIENDKSEHFNSFPELLKKALSVSFDNSIGIDFKDKNDIIERYNFYINRPNKIKLGTNLLNYITDGGFEKKKLNIYMSPSNVGKTWKLIDDAAFLFKEGYNILYITLEMSQEDITQRIETNLFELPTKDFKYLSFDKYKSYLSRIRANQDKKLGRLIVKEYPTSGANVIHFSALLDELEMKKNFIPEILIVDYLGIMTSVDIYGNGFEKLGNITKELRGLAVERELCVISAVQTNREGYSVSDFNLNNIAESIAIVNNSDFICGIIRDDTLDEIGEIWIKVLKNRYTSIKNKKFNLGTDIEKQKFFDIEQNESSDFNTIINENTNIKDFSKLNFD